MGIFQQSLDAIYANLAVDANLGALTEGTVRAIDKSDGVEVSLGEDRRVTTLIPAAVVRASELSSNGLTAGGLVGTTITLNGETWDIYDTREKRNPNGAGEYYLMLREHYE